MRHPRRKLDRVVDLKLQIDLDAVFLMRRTKCISFDSFFVIIVYIIHKA